MTGLSCMKAVYEHSSIAEKNSVILIILYLTFRCIPHKKFSKPAKGILYLIKKYRIQSDSLPCAMKLTCSVFAYKNSQHQATSDHMQQQSTFCG